MQFLVFSQFSSFAPKVSRPGGGFGHTNLSNPQMAQRRRGKQPRLAQPLQRDEQGKWCYMLPTFVLLAHLFHTFLYTGSLDYLVVIWW